MEKIIKKWWDNGSTYYQNTFNIPTDNVYYGPFCPTEKELNLIDINNIKGKKILELGCGGGQCSIFLSKNGAFCSGIDISKNQIKYAIKLAEQNDLKINYYIGSGENLKIFKDNEFDIVLSVFSLQYIKDINKCFSEINRVLKNNGKLIFSLDHPFYSVISSKTMKINTIYNKSGLNETIKTEDIIKEEKWHSGNKQKFIFYFRKISDICLSLIESNLKIDNIIEPISFSGKDPWGKIYSKKLAKYISPTIIFVAKNIKN